MVCAVDAVPLAPVAPVVQECFGGATALSPDDRYAIIGGDLWTTSGERLRQLVPDAERFFFSPDGKLLIATSLQNDGNARALIYEFPSGRRLRTLKGVFVVDASHWLRSDSKTVRFFDWQMRELGHFPLSDEVPQAQSATYGFSRDGRFVAVMPSRSGAAHIYEVKSGRLLQTLRDPRGGSGKEAGVLGPVAWSYDGKTLVTGGEDPDWQIPADDGGPQTEAFFFHAYALKIWNWRQGKIVRVVKGFGSNESGVQINGFLDANHVLAESRVVDIRSGKVTNDLSRVLHQYQYVAPDNRTILTTYSGGPGNYTSLIDVATGKIRVTFPRPSIAGKGALSWSPDGAFLAAGDTDSALVFDARAGKLIGDAPIGVERLFWKDNTHLRGERIGIVDEWEVGKTVRNTFEWRQPGTFTNSFSTSPQGTRAVTSATVYANNTSREELQVFDLASKAVVARFAVKDAPPMKVVKWLDENQFATIIDRQLEVFDVPSQTVARRASLPDDVGPGYLRSYSPIKKLFAVAATTKPKNDVAYSVTLLYRGDDTTPFWRQEKLMAPFAFSANGRFLVASRFQSESVQLAQIFDLEDMSQPPRVVKINRGYSLDGVALSPDGGLLAANVGSALKVYDVATGALRLSWKVFPATLDINQIPQDKWELTDKPAAWFALTPNGFYEGSLNAETWLRWRQNNALLPVGALKKERRRPDKIRASLNP